MSSSTTRGCAGCTSRQRFRAEASVEHSSTLPSSTRALAIAQRVVLQVWEENRRAVGLYESVGFVRTGTKRFAIGDELMEDAVFVLER